MADLLAGLKGIIEDQVAAPVLGGGIFAEDVDLEDRPLGQSLKREKSLISLHSNSLVNAIYDGEDIQVLTNLQKETRFFIACRYGDLVACKKIVKSGKSDDINRPAASYFSGDSPYHQACRYGHLAIVNYLLQIKCQEHKFNNEGQNAIMMASLNGHLDVVKTVCQNGARKEQKDKEGRSALFLASEGGYLDIVRYLVEAGVRSDRKALDGRTPLFAAAEKGFIDVVLFLMQSNNERTAKMAQRNKRKQDEGEAEAFLKEEAKRKEEEAVLALAAAATTANGGMPPEPDEDDESAAEKKTRQEAEELAAKKKLVVHIKDKSNVDGLTPIGAAARNGHVDIVRYLIKIGAQLDKADNDGSTPLYEASACGQLEAVIALVEAAQTKTQRQTKAGPLCLLRARKAITTWPNSCSTMGQKRMLPGWAASRRCTLLRLGAIPTLLSSSATTASRTTAQLEVAKLCLALLLVVGTCTWLGT